jgi:molybdopterin-dependent oxidoreductase alpha subunit
MLHSSHNIVVTNAQTSEKFTGLKYGARKHSAVGLPAIFSSIRHALVWMRPTDAVKTMFRINQKGGFDCPGCAWPDPDDDRSALGEYCENGLKAIAEEATKLTIDASFFTKHCVSNIAKWSDYEIGKKGRLTEPMYLPEGATHYQSISWERAFQLIAQELHQLASPDEAAFYTSGRTSNEAAFLYQLFVRKYGTNNLPDCSNMCHESSGKGLTETLGIGKGSVTLDDIHQADLILIIGQNPGTNHPRMLTSLEKCKENGGKIIAINPIPEAGLMHFIHPQNPLKILKGGTALADLFLQVKINGDVALLKAMLFLLLEEEKKAPGTIFDLDFIKDKTTDYQSFIENLAQYRLEDLIIESGVSLEKIKTAVQLIISNKKMIVCWAMGLTQHKNAVDNVREIVNLLLLRGSIGKPGAGTCPVRGHSNVQGDRTMGIWEAPKATFLDKLSEVYAFQAPRKHGLDVVHTIKAMNEGQIKVFFALGGNFLSATPDTNFTANALQKCRLTVHVSTKLNRSHLVHGKQALILPCLGRTEIDLQASGAQFVSVENSMGVVSSSQGVLNPCSKNLKSEVAIVCELAAAFFDIKKDKNDLNTLSSSEFWLKKRDNYHLIRDEIEKIIPGFEDFNQRILTPEGFYLPNCSREQKFDTLDGKAHFTINKTSNIRLSKGEYLMMTIRSHDQFNTTIYGLNDRYRGVYNERRVIFMNEKDLVNEGLKPMQVVNLYSIYKEIRRDAHNFIVLPYDIAQGCVATYFPEANNLIPFDEFADKSHTPISKSVVIRFEIG